MAAHRVRSRVLFGAASLAAILAAGATCIPQAAGPVNDGNVGVDASLYPGQHIQGEPNGSFDNPVTIILDASSRGHLRGRISSSDDVDVYALGSLVPGDRLIVDASSLGGRLDGELAIFDEAGRLAFENDDRNASLGQLDPFLNDLIRRDSSIYFIAIARSPLASMNLYGDYEVLLTVVPGGQVPQPLGQTVLLDFDGGSILIPPDEFYSVGPFDAADNSPAYSGRTAEVRNRIAAVVRENYEGLSLDVRVVPGDRIPSAGTYSTILFGGRNRDSFGISQNVDPYNADHSDSSIIFTSMFTASRFGGTLSVNELGTAIGNVATHELGHLLGLNHVANVRDLMDTTGDSLTLLDDQEFIDSPLDESIFPIGTQDGLLLLLETLGTSP